MNEVVVRTPMQYLDKAVGALRDVGLMPEKTEPAPINALLEKISDLDPDKILPRLQLQLEGVGTTTQGKRYGIQTPLNGPYKFSKVRPGDYRLRAQIGFTRLWDMPVTVGEKTVLDLNQDNAVAPKDVFLKRKS